MKYVGILAGAVFSGALLAACGGNYGFGPPTSVVPRAVSKLSAGASASRVETVLYAFKGGEDGWGPVSALFNNNGTLYGTTPLGGGSTCNSVDVAPGCGTIFSFGISNSDYDVIYRFPKTSLEGAFPTAGVIGVGNTLFGTTQWGGGAGCRTLRGCGTVFTLTGGKHWIHKILHAFTGGGNGGDVLPGLTYWRGTFYGATLARGNPSCDCGILYALAPNGAFHLLHTFDGADGNGPLVAPIVMNGMLYGTTIAGGGSAHCTTPYAGCGVLYQMSPRGSSYKVLHVFQGTDGSEPVNVIASNGMLYGVTGAGGGLTCNYGGWQGCGTVFSYNIQSKKYSVLYTFKGGKDGASPNAVLADVKGWLYSTAEFGGGTACHNFGGSGCGVLFKLNTSSHTPSHTYAIAYRFKGGTDGGNPAFYGVIEAGGLLYGLTETGGGMGCGGIGCGTIFSATP
jgi:uncharacterized repeat protein (TIGR03803 family)